MPASNDTRARVTKVLVHELGLEEDRIEPSATLQGDLGVDSIELLEMAFLLEHEFGIEIPSDELFSDQPAPIASAFLRDGRPADEGLAPPRLPYALRKLEQSQARPSSKSD